MATKDKKSEETALITIDIIERKIYVVREQKVMLDSDLAKLYEVETRSFKSSGQTQSWQVSRRFYVSIDERRI